MRYKILSVCAALAAVSACSDLTSINNNPNGPQDLDPPSMLAGSLDEIASGVNGVNSLNIRGAGLWVQYYAEIQYRDEDKYILRSGSSGGWAFYSGAADDRQRPGSHTAELDRGRAHPGIVCFQCHDRRHG